MPDNTVANMNSHSALVAKALSAFDAQQSKPTNSAGYADKLFAHGIVSIGRFADKAALVSAIAADERKAFIITYGNSHAPVFAAVPEELAAATDAVEILDGSYASRTIRDVLNAALPDPMAADHAKKNHQWSGQWLSGQRIDELTKKLGGFINATHHLKIKFSANSAMIVTRLAPALPTGESTPTGIGTHTL